jgi:hypothetical protein
VLLCVNLLFPELVFLLLELKGSSAVLLLLLLALLLHRKLLIAALRIFALLTEIPSGLELTHEIGAHDAP